MKGALQESRNLGRGRGQVRNRHAGHALHSFTDRSLTLGLHRLETGGGGGGLRWVLKGKACCTLQSPPLLPAYFFFVLWVPQRSHRQPEIGGEPGLWGGRASCALQSPPRLPAYFWGVPDPIGVPQTARNARNRRRGRGFGVGHKGQGLLRATVPPSFPLIFGAFPVPGSHRQPGNILTVAQHVPQTARQGLLHATVSPLPPPSAGGIKASHAHAKWAGKARGFWGG